MMDTIYIVVGVPVAATVCASLVCATAAAYGGAQAATGNAQTAQTAALAASCLVCVAWMLYCAKVMSDGQPTQTQSGPREPDNPDPR